MYQPCYLNYTGQPTSTFLMQRMVSFHLLLLPFTQSFLLLNQGFLLFTQDRGMATVIHFHKLRKQATELALLRIQTEMGEWCMFVLSNFINFLCFFCHVNFYSCPTYDRLNLEQPAADHDRSMVENATYGIPPFRHQQNNCYEV